MKTSRSHIVLLESDLKKIKKMIRGVISNPKYVDQDLLMSLSMTHSLVQLLSSFLGRCGKKKPNCSKKMKDASSSFVRHPALAFDGKEVVVAN